MKPKSKYIDHPADDEVVKKARASSDEDDEFENLVDEDEGDFYPDEHEEADFRGDEEDDNEDEDEDDEEVGDDSDGEGEQAAESANMRKLKAEMEDMSFDQLLRLKEKIGEKAFLQIQTNSLHKARNAGNTGTKLEPKRSGKPTMDAKSQKKSDLPKRKSKHAPQELPATRAVSRKRVVVETQQLKTRDPRFDSLSGSFNQGLFEKSYGFLDDYRKKEIAMISERLKKEKDPEERSALKQLHQAMISSQKTREVEEQRKSVLRDWRKKETEAVKSGKKPYFLKNNESGEKKKMFLTEKFKNMTPAQVEKALEKKRKNKASSERRFMPYRRERD
ncbi:rRNA biogenesis protein rrp36 [Phlyctochytrium bullatum]|nr:rRNA biogenesis protein rrp36 [Phlyctochytrium bullatum]